MEKFNDFWKNPKHKAIIKLSGWFIFFVIVVIFCYLPVDKSNITIEKNQNEESKTFQDLETLKNELLVNNYKYSYKINNLTEQSLVVYNGELNDGVDNGYYESKTEIFKYSCTIEKCYKLFSDHQEEFIMNEFPLSYILSTFDLIKNSTPNINEEENIKTYNYLVDVQGINWEIIIKTSYENIIDINLKSPNEIHELKFIK